MAEIQITLVLERNRIFTDLERQQLYQYLEEKYGVQTIYLEQGNKKGGK